MRRTHSQAVLIEVISRYNRVAFLGDIVEIFIEADAQETSGNIVNMIKAVALQCQASIIASLRAAAVQINRAVCRNFIHAAAQLAQGDIHSSFNMAGSVLVHLAHDDNACAGFH